MLSYSCHLLPSVSIVGAQDRGPKPPVPKPPVPKPPVPTPPATANSQKWLFWNWLFWNFTAATAQAKLSKAQIDINTCEEEIPRLKNELSHHNYECKNKLYNLRWEGKIGAGNVVVMTEVLKLTECKTGLLQTGQEPLKCKCQNGHHVVHFHDKSLHSPGTNSHIPQSQISQQM